MTVMVCHPGLQSPLRNHLHYHLSHDPPFPRSNSALITASSIHQRIDGHDRRCDTH